jgi:hypothetical protein
MKRTHKKTLNVETYFVGKVQPLSKELIEEYRFNLAELARKDKERIMLEEAKNNLESYIYKVKNKLMDDEENIAKISTEEQREELSKLSMEAEDWLFDEGDTAPLETIKAKLEGLSSPAEKIWFRLSEMTKRPEAVKDLREKLTEIETKFNKWVSDKEYITEEEKSDVAAKIETARKWLSDKEEEQAAKASHEDPVFTSEEVPVQILPVQKLVSRLTKKPKPKVEKNETDDKSSSKDNTTSPEGATDEEKAGETSSEEKTETESSDEAKEEEKGASKEEAGEEL